MTYYKGEDFDTLVSKGNFLIDFYADWCGPCKMLGSVLETISDIEIIKVNVDEYPQLANRFKIMSIPHLKTVVNHRPSLKNILLIAAFPMMF